MADRDLTLDDLDEVLKASPEVVPEALPVTPKAAPVSPDRGFGQFASTVVKQDWIPHAAARYFAAGGMEFDPEFDLGADVPEDEWKELTDGLSDDAKERLGTAAKSKAHLYFLTDLARESKKNEETLATYGGWGVAGRIGGNLIDPTNYLLAVGTGGIGVADKAVRLKRALGSAVNLGERSAVVTAIGTAAKSGHLATTAKVGLAAGAENVALQSLFNSTDMERDGWDLVYAGIGGVAIGGIAGRLLSGSEKNTLRRLHTAEKTRLEVDELRSAIDQRRTSIVGELGGDVDAARASVGGANQQVASFLAGRDADLTDYSQFRHALESGGRADAKSATSSATGIDQFTEGTWLGVVAQTKPKWSEGLTKADLLELRKDPSKSAEMVAALDSQNTAALRKSNAPVNHFTLYAMHHFGQSKGKVFAKAGDNVLMDDILSAGQLKANGYLKGLTKAQAIANWTNRARKAGVDTDGMVARVPRTGIEAQRAAEIEGFDRPTTEAKLFAVEENLKSHQKALKDAEEGAAQALPQGEARKLQREVDALQRELKGHRGKPTAALMARVADVEQKIAGLADFRATRLAAMRAEDDAKLGPEIASSKHRTKLREKAADHDTKVARKKLDRELAKAKDASGRSRYAIKERLAQIEGRHAQATKAASAKDTLRALKQVDNSAATKEGEQLRAALGLDDSRRAAQKADGAARDELGNLLKALDPKRAALDKLEALESVKTVADLRATSLERVGAAPAFGEDTLSAARVVGFDPGLFPSLEGAASGPALAKMKLAGALNFWGKGTFSGVLRGSDNAVVRAELGPLVGNALGNVGDTVDQIGASEIASLMQKKQLGKFHAAVTPAYDKWMKEQGIHWARQHDRNVRSGFMRELGLHIRGQESESEAVKAAAGRIKDNFKEFLQEAKAAGVKGFENVPENSNWLPRVFDFHAFHALNKRVGPDQLALLVRKGIQQTYEEMDDVLAGRIANAYIKRMRELRTGSDAGLMQGMSFDDVTYLRQFLDDAGLASDEVEDVVTRFASAKRGTTGETVMNQEGGFRHAKMRQKFDENFAMDLRDAKANDGSTIRVTISDLFENNVEALFGRYARTMSGHIGLAKVGIKSRADFTQRLKIVARELENDPGQLNDVTKKATAAYDLITARPLEDATMLTEMGRTGRDLAYATQMENVGLSNIPDIASLLAWGNFRYSAKSYFDGSVFGALWKRNPEGRMADDLMREIEESTGLGTDFLNNSIHSSYDISEEAAQELVDGGWLPRTVSAGFSKVSHTARVAGRAVTVGSGMAGINSFAQRLAARNIIYRIKDDVFKGGGFSEARAAKLGLDGPMKKRIEAQFKAHTEWTKGEMGGDIQRVNFNQWDDMDARDSFLYAIHREARKNIQEEDLGDTFMWQHKSWGKVISQFRRFGLTAWTKQTLRGIADHDAEAMTRAALQFTLAAGVWEARHQLVVAGMETAGADPEKIAKYRERNLRPDRIVAAGIRNAGFAALAPDIYDTTFGAAMGVPLFDVRNSGNSSKLIEGIPLVGLVNNIGNAAAGTWQAAVRGDKQFDKGDARAWQAIAPFGNHLMVAPVFEALTADLPDRDEDDDPDSFQWFFQ